MASNVFYNHWVGLYLCYSDASQWAEYKICTKKITCNPKYCYITCDSQQCWSICKQCTLHARIRIPSKFLSRTPFGLHSKSIFELQIMRDIAFMIPDLLNIVIPFVELKRQANKRRLSSIFQVLNKHDIFIAIASIVILWLILLSLPWIESTIKLNLRLLCDFHRFPSICIDLTPDSVKNTFTTTFHITSELLIPKTWLIWTFWHFWKISSGKVHWGSGNALTLRQLSLAAEKTIICQQQLG